jgi:hypothetical protein
MLAAAVGLAVAGAWVCRRPRRRRRVRPRANSPKLDLADLKAECQGRLESMQGCRLSVLEGRLEGTWLRLVVRVEPPTPETRWWPWGVSVECPKQLALRDAASQGPPLQGALPRRLEGHGPDDWVYGRTDLIIRVQTPDECQSLEIGYYGRPLARYQLKN